MKHKELIHRLNRITGQIDALKRNLESQGTTDCAKNMQLLKAATNAMKKFGEAYIQEHLNECIDRGESPKELEKSLQEIVKSAFSM